MRLLKISADILLKKDKFEKTFFAYISQSTNEVMETLIRLITNIDKNLFKQHNSNQSIDYLCYELPTHVDSSHQSAIEYAQQVESRNYTALLDPFYEDLCQQVKNQIKKTKKRRKELEDKENNDDEIRDDILRYIHPQRYHLFSKDEASSYEKWIESNFLTVIGKAQCLNLVKHGYTQCYLNGCWKFPGRYFFYGSLFLYVVMLLSLTGFTVNHEFQSESYNGTTTIVLFAQDALFVKVTQALLISFTVLNLVYEGLQIAAKRQYYLKSPDNIVDLSICFGCAIVGIAPLTSEYKNWHHQLGTCVMTIAWINAAWMMTKIPSFAHPYLQKLSLHFNMLFRVIQNVCIFLPVFALFTLTFALAFQNLFETQEPFSHVGYAIMKTIAMTIGEFDFGDIFFSEGIEEVPPFYTLSCILFVMFIGIMTISAMNLLVGMAVGDINELRDQSEIYAFQTLVDHIVECLAIVALFQCKSSDDNNGNDDEIAPVEEDDGEEEPDGHGYGRGKRNLARGVKAVSMVKNLSDKRMAKKVSLKTDGLSKQRENIASKQKAIDDNDNGISMMTSYISNNLAERLPDRMGIESDTGSLQMRKAGKFNIRENKVYPSREGMQLNTNTPGDTHYPKANNLMNNQISQNKTETWRFKNRAGFWNENEFGTIEDDGWQ